MTLLGPLQNNTPAATDTGAVGRDLLRWLNLLRQQLTNLLSPQGPFRPPPYTTAQRDELTVQNGDMIFNTSTQRAQLYASGAWTDL